MKAHALISPIQSPPTSTVKLGSSPASCWHLCRQSEGSLHAYKHTLTDSRCRFSNPADKAQKLFDGGGLFLFVSPAGGKIWRLAYRLAGKPKTLSLGEYLGLSLADARAKRDQVKVTLREGTDPMATWRAGKSSVTLRKAFKTCWGGRQDVSTAYCNNATRTIGCSMTACPDGLAFSRFPMPPLTSSKRVATAFTLRMWPSHGKPDFLKAVVKIALLARGRPVAVHRRALQKS